VQNGHTKRVPCAFGVFSTITDQPGLQILYSTCSGGAAGCRERIARTSGLTSGLAACLTLGLADFEDRTTDLRALEVRLEFRLTALDAAIVLLSLPRRAGYISITDSLNIPNSRRYFLRRSTIK
jgi:hypothetical protein